MCERRDGDVKDPPASWWTHKDEILPRDGLVDLFPIAQFSLDDLAPLFGQFPRGRLGGVPSDRPDLVGLVALEQVTEDAAALDAGGSEDGDRGGVGVGRGDHGDDVGCGCGGCLMFDDEDMMKGDGMGEADQLIVNVIYLSIDPVDQSPARVDSLRI